MQLLLVLLCKSLDGMATTSTGFLSPRRCANRQRDEMSEGRKDMQIRVVAATPLTVVAGSRRGALQN